MGCERNYILFDKLTRPEPNFAPVLKQEWRSVLSIHLYRCWKSPMAFWHISDILWASPWHDVTKGLLFSIYWWWESRISKLILSEELQFEMKIREFPAMKLLSDSESYLSIISSDSPPTDKSEYHCLRDCCWAAPSVERGEWSKYHFFSSKYFVNLVK